jgi:hypothetical protein
MKSSLLSIIFCFILSYSTLAQTQVKPIEYRFEKGEKGLVDFITQGVIFPKVSQVIGSIGLSISGISITPAGKIENIKIINPIDEFIDAEVIRLLKSTSGLWLKCDTVSHNQTFFIQIAFVISGSALKISVTSPVSYRFFIEPVTVTNMNLENNDASLPQSDELVAIKCIVLVSSQRYNEALDFINELIKRNPFKKELYQYRITIYKNMNRQDLIEADVQKLTNFADGFSLDEILNRN